MAVDRDIEIDTAVQLATLQIKYQNLEEKYNDLEEKIEKLEATNKKISEMAARWKGGGAMLIVLGSLLGAFFTYYDKLRAFFPKLGG